MRAAPAEGPEHPTLPDHLLVQASGPTAPLTMKMLVLAVVLLCVYNLEGAVVKRETEGPSSSLTDVFSQYFQTVSEYLQKHLPETAKLEEIKTQAKTYLDQANEQLSPIAKRLHTEFMELLTQLVETGRKAVKQ